MPAISVVGGSIGGLTAALVLRDAGCDVRVFERSPAALTTRGAGIAILDSTLKYLVERGGLRADVAWRGTLPESELSPATYALLGDALTYQVLPGSHILVYPIPGLDGSVRRGERLINMVWYVNVAAGAPLDELMTGRDGVLRPVSLPPGAATERALSALRRTAVRRLAPPLAEVVTHISEPFIQVIYDIEVSRMAFGRICLIGDAAFAVRPHAAAGTAKAAADGWALAEELTAAGGNVPAALAAWERRQLALGHDLLARCRAIGDSSQFLGTFRPGDPRLIFGLYGPGN